VLAATGVPRGGGAGGAPPPSDPSTNVADCIAFLCLKPAQFYQKIQNFLHPLGGCIKTLSVKKT